MISSQTLKRFVQMHDDKLTAKMHGWQTGRQDAALDAIHGEVTGQRGAAKAEHWRSPQFSSGEHRPKSRYFKFILTTNS